MDHKKSSENTTFYKRSSLFSKITNHTTERIYFSKVKEILHHGERSWKTTVISTLWSAIDWWRTHRLNTCPINLSCRLSRVSYSLIPYLLTILEPSVVQTLLLTQFIENKTSSTHHGQNLIIVFLLVTVACVNIQFKRSDI